MTTTTTDPAATRATRRTASAAPRRPRRGATPERVARAGRPVRSALLHMPFVVALILVLALGVGGVLYLNTKIDASGVRTEKANAAVTQLNLDIEALNRNIAQMSATPRIADEARKLGLVPAGDAAMLVIGKSGKAKLIGKPTPVAAPSGAHR